MKLKNLLKTPASETENPDGAALLKGFAIFGIVCWVLFALVSLL